MIARTLKILLNSEISNSIKDSKNDDSSIDDNSMFSRHPPIKKSVQSILKSSSSASNFKQNSNIRGEHKVVGFHDPNDINTSQDIPNVEDLDDNPDYITGLLTHDRSIEWYADFFNLVFGNTHETTEFFKD